MNTQMQLKLVLPEPRPIISTDRRGGLEESFKRFHAANPHVYEALKAVALWCVRHKKRMGIKAIYERVRWEYSIATSGSPYKLNNNFSAHYSRLLMKNEPELAGFFETRRRRAI
jgi:hypothetical protein